MARVPADFLRFLYANYPDDWRKVSVADVPEDVITAIKSKHARHYEIWKDIPEWIKSEYGDKLPKDVLNGNETTQHFVNEEIEKKEKKEQNTAETVSYAVDLLALGYAVETVKVMAENRAIREQIFQEANGEPLTKEQWERIHKTHASDYAAIENDWDKYQPEKLMLHLAKALTCEKKRQKRLSSKEDIAQSQARIKELEKKLRATAKRFDTRSVKMNMVDFLKGVPQQACLRHMHPEVRKMFTDLLEEQGIRISPVRSMQDRNHTLVSRESFTKDLDVAMEKIKQQTKSVKGADRFAKVLADKRKKSKGKSVKKEKEQEPKTTLTLRPVKTLEII